MISTIRQERPPEAWKAQKRNQVGVEIFSKEVENFANRTTFHGFRFLVPGTNRASIWRRLLWLSVVVLVYSYLLCAIIWSIMTFLEYSVSTRIVANHHPSMMFPAVTVCNQNSMRMDFYLENLDRAQLLQPVITDGLNDADFDQGSDEQNTTTDTAQWNLTEIVISGAHQIEDMLLDCTWLGFDTCTATAFTSTMTDFGVCYTFNAMGSSKRVIYAPGSSQGLKLRFDIQQELYTMSEYGAAGLKVLIHPPNELPLVRRKGFSVAPGFETEVSIQKVKTQHLLPPYEPGCEDRKLRYSGVYTSDLCRYECEVDKLIEICGCKDFTYPGDARTCDLDEYFQCVKPVKETISALVRSSCSCPEPCVTERFDSKISMSQWPSEYHSEYISRITNKTTEYIRKNFLEINVYFENLQSEEAIDSPAYGFCACLGDIGGYMGLFCGASVLTFLEVIDCVMVTLSRIRSAGRIPSV